MLQLTGQDNLNLTKQSIAQQRRCVTPLGTLRPTTSMGATQSPGFTNKGRSLGRDNRARRSSLASCSPKIDARSKSPERSRLEGTLSQLMKGKKTGESVSRSDLVAAVGKLAQQARLDKQTARSITPGGRGVGRPSTHQSSRSSAKIETRMDSVGRHFGAIGFGSTNRTRKDESFRKTRYNAEFEMICDSPI